MSPELRDSIRNEAGPLERGASNYSGPVFGPPSDPIEAGVHSVAVALVFLVIGYLMVNALLGRRDVDPVVRSGLVLPSILGGSLALMLVHIVTGGWLFSNPPAVRAITVLVLAALAAVDVVRRRRYQGEWPRVAALALFGVVAVAIFIWGRAVFELLPAGRSGDAALHAGWAASLLNGDRLPTNALTGEIPNYYPWLFQALLAWVSALTPGGRPLHALGPMQILQIAGAATTLFAVGYALWRGWAAGVTTAILGMITGGFGFLAESPRLVFRVRGPNADIGSAYGDLMARRSYNTSFHNLVPAHPRELTYALLPALILLLFLALRTRARIYLIASGCLLGIIGLTGGEVFIAGVLLSVVFVMIGGEVGRIRAALYIALPTAVLYSLWLVPVIVNYGKYGGFVDLSSPPVGLTFLQVLGGWGVVTPFAVLGLGLLTARLRKEPGARVVIAALGSTAALLILVLVLGPRIGAGFDTLGRAHRYWPMVFLSAAICAGFGFFWLLEQASRLHRLVAVILFLGVAAVALASPWIGTREVKDATLEMRASRDPTLMEALQGDELTWPAVLSPSLGDRCTVAVPEDVSVMSYAYTGYRHVLFGWASPGNTARVRWRDIYSYIPPDAVRRSVNTMLVTAQASPERFRDLVERYGVDRVLVNESLVELPALEGYRIEGALGGGQNFGVVFTGDCSD